MEPASIFVGSVVSCVVTELMKVLIEEARAAVRCRPACEVLENELTEVCPEVEMIEQRLATLRETNRAGDSVKDDLHMVERWLRRLKDAIMNAQVDVHGCSNVRIRINQSEMFKRLQQHFDIITHLGQSRTQLFLQLGGLLPPTIHAEMQQERAESCSDDWGNLADERNSSLPPESPRHLMSSSTSSSGHRSCSSDFGAFDNTVDSSDVRLLQQRSSATGVTVLQRDVDQHALAPVSLGDTVPAARKTKIAETQGPDSLPAQDGLGYFQRDDEQHAPAHISRRNTFPAVTQAEIARAYGHDPLPAHDGWKYFQRDNEQHAPARIPRRQTMPAVTQAEIATAYGHDPLPAQDEWKY